MNDAEWVTCDNPQPMLAHLDDRVGERELREFAVACCLRVWHLLPQPSDEFRSSLQLCQRLAQQPIPDRNRARLYLPAAAATAAFAVAAAEHSGVEAEAFAAHAVYAASALAGAGYADDEVEIWSVAADAAADEVTTGKTERVAQAELARQFFGSMAR